MPFRRIRLPAVLLIAYPLLLLLVDPNWIYAPASGVVDMWLYLGFMRDLPTYLRTWSFIYAGDRLPWLLPGYALYHLLPPLIANAVLHLGVYYLATFSLYVILRLLYNERVALITALLMGSYAWLLAAAGWDYVDGAEIAYMLLTLALLTCAAKRSRSRGWLLAAGIAAAAMLGTNLFTGFFLPLMLAYYLYLNARSNRNRLITSAALFAAGALVLTAVLSAYAYPLTGHGLFFQNSLNFSNTLLSGVNQLESQPFSYFRADFLAFPIAVVIAGWLVILLARKRANRRLAVFWQSYFSLTVILFVGLNALQSLVILHTYYYVSLLIPGLFLALGSLLAMLDLSLTGKRLWIAALSIVAIGLASRALIATSSAERAAAVAQSGDWKINEVFVQSVFDTRPVSFAGIAQPYPILLPIAVLVIGLLLVGWKPSIKTLLIFLACFGISNAAATWYLFPGSRDAFLAFQQGMSEIELADPDPGTFYFWFGKDSFTLYGAYEALTSAHLWGGKIISDTFPSFAGTALTPSAAGTLAPGSQVVIFSTDADAYAQAQASLQQRGLSADLMSQSEVRQGQLDFKLYFLRLKTAS